MKTLHTIYSTFAKHNMAKFLTVLTMLLIVGVGQAWGATATAEFLPSHFSGQGTTSTGSAISATINGVTFACDKGYGTTQIRCYSGSKITISSSNTITAISFTLESKYQGGLEASYTNLSTNSWEKDLSSQARITKCVVTYEEASADPYTVTLEAGSGSVTDTELTETSAGAGVTLPPATIDCGDVAWSFAGWATASVDTETETEPTLILAGAYSPTSDITLYAVYKRTEEGEGGGGGDVTESVDFSTKSYSDGQEVSSYEGTNFSVTFDKGTNSNAPKYYNSGTAIRVYAGGYFIVSSEATITKIVLTFGSSDKTNTITTNIDTYSNGTWTGSATSVQFTIGGTKDHRRIQAIEVTTSGSGSSSTTYYHSTPDCITETTVSLDPNGGTGTMGDVTTENGTLTLPKCTFTREGYTFAGWATSASGEVEFADEEVVSNWDAKITKLFAQWTAKTITITWDANGGSVTPTSSPYTYDGATIALPTPTRTGYSFNGWFTAATSGTKITEVGTTNKPTENVTYYAQWTEKPLTRYRTDCDACIPLDGYAEINGTYHFFPGETITLTVTPPADADPADCTYQWQKKVNSDYENIEGETGLTYTKVNATTSDVGHYRCVVSSEGYCDLYPKYDVKCLQLYVYYDNKSDVFNTPLNRGAEENTATISVDLQNANYKYYFKITDGCGNWYGNMGTMVRDNCTNWPMDVNEYCGLQTTKFGTYVFNVNYSDLAHLTVSVIYPAALQEAGKEIYLDNNVLKWTYSNNADGTNKIYYRIGRSDHNNKIAMDLVPGTANLYKVTTSKYDNFDVWHIANNGCHSEFNSIFKTKTNDKWAATQATAFETLPVTLDAVTVTPTTLRSVGGDDNNSNCEFFNYDITEGMKKHKATVIPATGGTITVSYTDYDGTAKSDFTSSERDLAHTCLLTITATPDAGYSGALTVNGEPFTSGNVHTLAEDAVIEVVWTEKKVPTFAWSADSYTAALEADNTFPTLNNPNSLSVTYTSSDENVAKIDANGNIVLGSEGRTTITAIGAESATHKSATDFYELFVVAANCKWVEVTDNTTLEDGDEVVITMGKSGKTYALPNAKRTTSDDAPEATDVTSKIVGNEMTSVTNNIKWTIERVDDYYVFYTISNEGRYNLYCNSGDNGVCVAGSGNALINHKFSIEGNYLKSQAQRRFLAVSINTNSWRSILDNTTSTYSGQTLKFYKRECLDSEHYWVTWDAGEGTWEDKSSKKLESYQVGAPITQPTEPTREGYRFDGWDPTPGNMPAGNTTFTAKWTQMHTITWMVGNNPVLTEKVANTTGVTQTPGDDIADNAIGDCANAFMGWSETPLGSTEGQSAPAVLCTAAQMKTKHSSVNSDKTFHAVFATKGSGGIAQGTVLWAENFGHFGTKKPSEAGTGTGTTVYDGASITYSQSSNNTKGYNEQIAGGTAPELLLAKNNTTWTIAGIPTGGATQMELSFLSNRTEFNVTSSTTGITINGSETAWNIEADSDVTNFTLTIKNTSDKNARLDNVSVVVAEGGVSYSNYVTNCCNTPAPTNGAYTSVSGTEIKLTWDDAANTNRYHITGGNLSAEGVYVTNKYYNITGLTECEEYTFNVSAYPEDGCESEAITITAQPFSGAKTVTFNYNGNGQTNTTTSTSCNNKSITLPTPVWAGYRFMGWFTAESGGAEIDDNPYTPTEDITLFAHWEKEYTVTYDLQGGTASPVCSGDKYIAGETVIICTSTPVKSGYRFIGWTYAPDVTITNGQFTMHESNVTITAEFVARVVTNIEVATNTHRVLMQGSTFIGEQIRVTYDNGETETLDWGDTRLTFSGYNMATLGTYTVRVDYNDCGTANTSYSIEVIDGIAITFIDAGISETIKYELNAHVDVETKTGQYACSGYEFVGWSETEFPLSDVPNMRTSEEYVPVRNFNATTSRTLYAVYSILKKQGWVSIEDANHIRSGAEYMIVKNRYDTYSALSTTTSTYNANYRAATILDKDEDDNTGNMIVWRRTSDNTDFQIYTGTATNYVKWLLIKKDNKNYLYNQTEKKYLQVTTTAITLTSEMADNFKITNESGDCCLNIQSATSNYYISGYNSSNNYYFQPYSTETDANYLLTRDSLFTTTPPCSPLFATFYGNGGIVTDGIKSGDYLTIKEPTRDAGITTPTASFADCNGKSWTFVGWSREEIDVTRVPVLTTDLLHDGGGNKHYDIEEDGEEFWAVFTNTGDPETKYGTITFTDADVTREYADAKKITKSVTAMGDYDFELYHVSNASSKGIQFDHNNATRGYIKNITSLGKINSISLNDFQVGDIDDVKVYVGNMPNAINTLLTEADLQQTGNTYTYYPPKNYAYVKIEATGYCGITSISIDFGQGTQIWATTPDCSDIFLSGNELYVTSTNGQSIRAAERLTVNAVQLESKAKVVISSNSSDIYFSDVLDANFTQAVKPTETLTLTAGVDGNLAATEIYVHYRPSVDGTGIPEDVVVSANLETPNPSITDDHTIHVRNLPADFVIAAKVNDIWYALPNNCNSTSIVNGLPIDVDDPINPTSATFAPAEAKWGLKPVYTTSGVNDRYGDVGEYFVFAETNTGNAGLLYSNKDNAQVQTQGTYSGISGYTEITRYEWIPTTTDLSTYQLASAADSKLLSINVNGVFGTHSQLVAENKLRLLPIEAISKHAEVQVVEWRKDAVVFMYTGNPTHKVTTTLASTSTTKPLSEIKFDHGVYKMPLSNLLNNEGKSMSIRFYDGSTEVARTEIDVPVIVNSDMNTNSLSTMAKADYETCDVVILNGGKLTASETSDGSQYRFRNVTIYGGGKLIIGEGKYLSMASIILRAGGFANDGAYEYVYPQFELKGNLTNTVGKFYYDYITDNDHWYHLVLPFAGDLGTIKYPTEFYGSNVTTSNSGSWIIKRYAGDIRATGNYKAWVDIETDNPEPTSTTPGVGYIFWGAPKKVKVNGVENRQQWGIQRISMTKGAETAKTAENGDKTISGLSSYEDVANKSDAVNDQGWNLIGNPYMVNIATMSDAGLKAGKLEEEKVDGKWTGKWINNGDNLRYLTIPSEHFDTYEAKTVSEAISANALVPGRAFFVQLDGEANGITFAAANRASLMPALLAENSDKPVDIETGIILSNETLQDEVNFWIKAGKTNDYEYNADYPKTPNNNNFNIYGVHTNGDLSWVAISPEIAAESMPIGYQVPAAGTYMLSLSEIYNSDGLDALYVTDHALSPEVTVDIMSESYEFSVNQAETNNERFTVSVKVKEMTESGTTGVDNIGTGDEQIHKFIYQDKIYILHHGVIYDATGKRVITINK